MATELTIHIGPPKTATTTIQAALCAHRGPLLESGVLYPLGFGGDDLHLWAAIDLAHRTGLDFPPLPFSRALFDHPASYRGAWQDLLAQTRAHDGPVVWSSEGFTYLGEAGVAAVADATAGIPGRVVWVARRPSQAIPSMYVEAARVFVVGPFEQYVRDLVSSLAAGRRHESDYLDGRRLTHRWEQVGMPVHEVSAAAGLSDAVVETVLRELTGEPVPLIGHRLNPSLTHMGTAAWQAHLRDAKPTYAGATRAVLDWFSRAHPAVVDRTIGGTLALAPSAAVLVDTAFAPDFPTGAAEQARARLLSAASGTEPLTCELPGTLTDSADVRWERVIASLPGRQRRQDAKWALIAAGARAIGRRPPVRLTTTPP